MRTYVTPGVTRHAHLRLAGYYLQRLVTSRTVRGAALRMLVMALGWARPQGRAVPRQGGATAQRLRRTGIADLGALVTPSVCGTIRAWLRERTLIDARGSGRMFTLADVPPATRVADYPMETVVHCPHVLDIVNHPLVLGVARHYLGYGATLTGLGLRWSFPAPDGAADQVQQFHRDAEPGSIKLLVYLTDVDTTAGPHHYVAGSHRDRMPLRLRRYPDAEIARTTRSASAVVGAAGTAFMIDAKGIHKGAPPRTRARLVLVAEYSLLPCLLFDYAPVQYHGPGRYDAWTNRLMIAQQAASDTPAYSEANAA